MLLRSELPFPWSDTHSPLRVDIALPPPVDPLAQQLFPQFPYDTAKLSTSCQFIAATCPYCDPAPRKVMASEEELAELHRLSSDYAPNDEVGHDRPPTALLNPSTRPLTEASQGVDVGCRQSSQAIADGYNRPDTDRIYVLKTAACPTPAPPFLSPTMTGHDGC